MVRLALLLFLLLAPPVEAQEAPRVWRVCITNSKLPPLLTQDPGHPGVLERLLVDASKEAGWSALLLRYPVERCRLMIERGEADAFLATPVPGNLELMDFPMREGQPDRERMLALAHLLWIKRSGAPGEWDGKRLSGVSAHARVGIRHGMRFGLDPLKALGLEVDSSSIDALHLLRRLQAGRFDLAVMLQPELESVVQQHPELGAVVALPRPFLVGDFYAGVSKKVEPALRPRVEVWWTTLARLRDRPDYKP